MTDTTAPRVHSTGGVSIVVRPRERPWLTALKSRPILIAAPIVIIAVLYFFVFRSPEPITRASDKPLTGSGNTYGAPVSQLTERQTALIDEGNTQASVETAAKMDAGQSVANVGSIYTDQVTAEAMPDSAQPVAAASSPPPVQPRQPSTGAENRTRQRPPNQAVTQYTDRLYQKWGSTSDALTYATKAPEPAAVAVSESIEGHLDLDLPIGRPIAAVLRVGANSDAPGAVVAELSRPRVRLIGEARRTAPDQVVVTFDSVVTQTGAIYSLQAQALDPVTGSPALEGRVKRHILANLFGTVTGTTVAYLGGYARGVRSNPSAGLFALDPTLALRATAAETITSVIPPQREPTVTVDAGTPIQVLITSPVRLSSPGSATPSSSAQPTDFEQSRAPEPINLDAYTTPNNSTRRTSYGYQGQ